MLPLCSGGTISLGIGLFRSRAAVGNILAYMIAGPATNLDELNAIRKARGQNRLFFMHWH